MSKPLRLSTQQFLKETNMSYFRPLAFSAMFLAASAALYPAQAASLAFPAADLNLRSGPSTRFPAVTVIRRGSRVTVHGCIEKYTWCDVSAGRYRGWASAAYLDMAYGDHYYRLPVYITHAPVPVVQFEISTYWEDYYAEYDFFEDRQQWYQYSWYDEAPPPGWGDWDDDGVDDEILDEFYDEEDLLEEVMD